MCFALRKTVRRGRSTEPEIFLRMRSLRSYGLCQLGAILAVIPCIGPCYLLGIPFGIWALIALNRPGVREVFSS